MVCVCSRQTTEVMLIGMKQRWNRKRWRRELGDPLHRNFRARRVGKRGCNELTRTSGSFCHIRGWGSHQLGKHLRWKWWAMRLHALCLPLTQLPSLLPLILHVQGRAWLYKRYLIVESFPMPRFSGEINLWLKYWRTRNLSSAPKQSGSRGGGVGSKKKKINTMK